MKGGAGLGKRGQRRHGRRRSVQTECHWGPYTRPFRGARSHLRPLSSGSLKRVFSVLHGKGLPAF